MNDESGLDSWQCVCNLNSNCGLSGWVLVEYILFCHVIWWISYWFLLLLTKQSEEWCCRVLTCFHGCMVSFLSLYDLFGNRDAMPFQNTPLSEAQKNCLSLVLSYFIFDFLWIHFFGNEAWVIYFHHLTSIFILIKIFVSDFGGKIVSYAVAGLEFTNPYLQLRWFLRSHGYLNTPIHSGVELWFFFTFLLIRLGGGTIVLHRMLCSNSDTIMKLSSVAIYLISLLLAWQIFLYFKNKYLSPQNERNISFITSTVSISPYFQRRTLDPPSNVEPSPEETE